MNVMDSACVFKLKQWLDCLIKKYKARLCARGDQQIEGVDFFETYAPVIQWTTVRLILISEILLDLNSKQCGGTVAFLQWDLKNQAKFEFQENTIQTVPISSSYLEVHGQKDGTLQCAAVQVGSMLIH